MNKLKGITLSALCVLAAIYLTKWFLVESIALPIRTFFG